MVQTVPLGLPSSAETYVLDPAAPGTSAWCWAHEDVGTCVSAVMPRRKDSR
ncbi:hypothetical protein [Streptodolium elevatio]|uniref:Uncharacterized protein n=1 Tax=Streptodolium elevatio TaxID=3157996 RepID=A0ABV3DJ92_9ACTN